MKKIVLLVLLFATPWVAFAQISGIVFRDVNGDGIQQTTGSFPELGLPGATLQAYDNNNVVVATTLTALDGSYTLPYTVPVRLELEISSNIACSNGATYFFGSPSSGDNVRFLNAPSSGVNFAVHSPEEFRISNPDIFISSYIRGDPLQAGTSALSLGFASSSYNSLLTGTWTLPTSPNSLTTAPIGSVWGAAYDKHAKGIFLAAFLKRNMGLGPLGSGGIYFLQPNGASFSVVNFYDLDANGYRTRAAANAVAYGSGTSFNIAGSTQITYLGPVDPVSGSPEGLGVIGVNGPGGRNLAADYADQRHDSSTHDQIAKVGLGDIEISEDGRFLFVMNLYDSKLYRLELDNVKNPTAVTQVLSFALPTIPVSNGVLRPFAVTCHNNKVYVGATATGENGGTIVMNGPTDVYSYVFVLNDPMGTPTFAPAPILTIPYNYGRFSMPWNPWSSNTLPLTSTNEYPTPILSNIDFTMKEDMLLNITDRSGHQYGFQSLGQLSGSGGPYDFISYGEVLIAGYDCNSGNYTLENNGQFLHNGTNVPSAYGISNSQGIGGGEFFHDSGVEPEGSQGSGVVIPGTDTMVNVLMDPVSIYETGLSVTHVNDGMRSLPSLAYPSFNTFGKGNSMGEVEMSGDVPEINLGNRVWRDINGNGIQDPLELGIMDVEIELYADFNKDSLPDGAVLAYAITDANGKFVFNSTNVSDGDPSTSGNQPGLLSYRTYLLRIGPSDWSGGTGTNDLASHGLSLTHNAGSGQGYVRDNDAMVYMGVPTIFVSLNKDGQNDYDQDFGFNACKPIQLSDQFLNCNTPSIIIGPTPVSGSTYTWLPPTGLNNSGIAQPIASPTTTTTYTLTIDHVCPVTLTVYVDETPPPVNAGQDKMITCDDTLAMLGSPAQTGITYQWNPPTGLSDPTIAQPIAQPNATTVYTLTATGENGCVSTDEVTVTRNLCCAKITVPNIFSPNQDNLNDYFGIIEIKHVSQFKLLVFNRFGEEVFRTETKDIKWDGRFRGKDCDVGTYFYLLQYDCADTKSKEILKGDINLVR